MRTAMDFLARRLPAVVLCGLLGGCAIGQQYGYDQAVVPLQRTPTAGTVALGVRDARPYVISGNKPETFVGLMRGGFGNPFDVNTRSGKALATDMRDVIERAFVKRGMQVSTVTIPPSQDARRAASTLAAVSGRRKILMTLEEWKSDTMVRTELLFDVTLVVYDETGAELARNRLKGAEPVAPSPHTSVPEAFARKIEALFDDDKIIAALR